MCLESLTDVLHMLTPGVWMASVDLHHAYYSIPVADTINRIFLFYGRELTINIHACQMAMPKLLCFLRRFCGHLFAYLRRQGHMSVVYIYDTSSR